MKSIGKRLTLCALLFCLLLLPQWGTLRKPSSAMAAPAAEQLAEEKNALRERLVVRYALDDTATWEGGKLAATAWDKETAQFVPQSSSDATVVLNVNNKDAGTVSSKEGKDGKAFSFTAKAHAEAPFQLPAGATGMTISLWVKNITTYWGSLVEFWNGRDGGRLGKGTMQGNGGRHDESDPWSSNCSAHGNAKMAAGGGWDSFCVTVNSGDNGGAAIDPMEMETWYQVTFALTATEMRAYRDGVLKQTFDNDAARTILSSIMKSATGASGKLGIRLSHDTTDDRADILDELRIYNGAMTDEEVRTLYFDYDPIAELSHYMPEYYDVKGLGYPDILLGGAEEVTDGENGTKQGVMKNGLIYSYTPITEKATAARDEQGVQVTGSGNGASLTRTLKFRRTIEVKAEKLGYRLNEKSEAVDVPQNAAEPIVVRVPAGTDLSDVRAGDIAVQKLDGDSSDDNYSYEFSYDPVLHTARVRCIYEPFRGWDALYTIVFVERSSETLISMKIEGGTRPLTLFPADFTDGQATIPVKSLEDLSLKVEVVLAEGASGTLDYTIAEGDLEDGKYVITLTSEDGKEVTYTLVPAVLSSDTALSALTAEGFGLKFEANKTDYEIAVGKGEGAALFEALTATPRDSKAKVSKVYDRTNGLILITVTAEDGSTQQYRVTVLEQDADATLLEIRVGGEPIEGFEAEKLTYTIKYAGTMPAVEATAASSKAQVSVGEADGNGAVRITVRAESGAEKIYTVTLVKMSGDVSLKLTVNGTEIAFTDGAGTYAADLGVGLFELELKIETAEGASAVCTRNEENDTIALEVTAEDGTAKVYTLTVTRAAASFEEGRTEDNAPAEKGGCGAVMGGTQALIVLCALAAGAVLIKRKDRGGK